MSGPAGLMDFAGRWDMQRQIADDLGGRTGRLTGHAEFSPDGVGLIYREFGRLELGDAPPMEASRSYLWRSDHEGGIAVLFPDGRPFITFSLEAIASATHHCAPDIYRVHYEFAAWPAWSTTWQVTGPRKNYSMVTHYVPSP